MLEYKCLSTFCRPTHSFGVPSASFLMALSVEAGGAVDFLMSVLGPGKSFAVDFVLFTPEMKARHPLWTFLRLRVTCRSMVWPCIVAMDIRMWGLLKSPRYIDEHRRARHCGCQSLTQLERLWRIRDSGVLHQMWAPTSPSLHRRRLAASLFFDGDTLRPMGMTQDYWKGLLERVGPRGHGRIDGVLHL